jgi:hypothetical protein
VFVFLDSPRVRELFASLQRHIEKRFPQREPGAFSGPPISLEALPEWIENLYFDSQSRNDFTFLNVALHMLCSRGAEMEPVRDYAAEVLRLFWQVFLPSKEPRKLERFIGTFGRFCYAVLYRGGLADIDPVVTEAMAKRAEFRMRPSAFIRAWANLTRAEGS